MLQDVAAHRTPHLASVPFERVVLDTLSDVGVAFTTERQLDPVLDRLLGTALQVVRADAGSVMLLSRERDTLVVVAARGPRARTILGTRQPADRSVAGWALRAGETVLLHGSAHEQPISDHPRELASSVVVPLALAGRLVGVMNASREPGAPRMDEQAARLLELLANQAAILIDNAQMLDELQRKDQRLEQLVDQLLGETGRRPATSVSSRSWVRPTARMPLSSPCAAGLSPSGRLKNSTLEPILGECQGKLTPSYERCATAAFGRVSRAGHVRE